MTLANIDPGPFASMTAAQVVDFEKRLKENRLTREEAAKLNDIGEAIKALGGNLVLPPKSAKDRARANLASNKPLDRWDTQELMAFLPDKASDTEQLEKLSDLQLACLAQHCLNTYEGALQLKFAPELVKRIARRPTEPVTMQAAWQLYRSGAATLEEIMPLMDRACELPETTEPVTVDE